MLMTYKVEKGDMKVPTFYAIDNYGGAALLSGFFFLPVVGVIFGGIHCAGWNFNFPSNNEATLWRVSSALITSIPFLLFFIVYVIWHILDKLNTDTLENPYVLFVFVILLQAYVVSRLLLLVEALISLRHLTPGIVLCKARPEAVSQAKPGPNRPGQAGPF